MIDIQITEVGGEEIARVIKRAEKYPRGLLVKGIAEAARSGVYARTALGLDVHGKKFQPLTDFTARQIRSYGQRGHGHILFDSGAMMKSMKVLFATESIAKLGFDSKAQEDKARDHNVGRPEKRLPQREFFGLSSHNWPLIDAVINEWAKQTVPD